MTVIHNVLEDLDFSERIADHGASICAETWGETTVIAVSGEIDASNADFTATVLHGFAEWNGEVVIDLTELDFIGTQGLRLLVQLNERCQRENMALAVVPNRMLRRLMQLIDIGSDLPVAQSVDDAVLSVARDGVSPGSPAPVLVDPEKLRC